MLSSAQMGAIITSTTPAFMVLFARMILGGHFYCVWLFVVESRFAKA